MKKFVLACASFLLLGAHVASAAVVINEVAWMGTASSSANEWIELHNTGEETQDLTGWRIVGKGGATITTLSGAVTPDQYFLIERGKGNFFPDVAADLTTSFAAGLSNDGETLKLLDGGGTVVDTVVGGKHWSKIGGDNTSKETAQRTSSGWITALATPRAVNKEPALAAEIAPTTTIAPPVKKVSDQEVTKVVAHPKTFTAPPAADIATKKVIQSASSSAVGASVIWQRKADENAEKDAWAWMVFALMLVVIAAVIIAKTNVNEPNEADKYAIIEDIIEGKDDDNRLTDY